MVVQELASPEDGKRVETGVVQFGDDWPGVFLRGDDAYLRYGSAALIGAEELRTRAKESRASGDFAGELFWKLEASALQALGKLLRSCNVNGGDDDEEETEARTGDASGEGSDNTAPTPD